MFFLLFVIVSFPLPFGMRKGFSHYRSFTTKPHLATDALVVHSNRESVVHINRELVVHITANTWYIIIREVTIPKAEPSAWRRPQKSHRKIC